MHKFVPPGSTRPDRKRCNFLNELRYDCLPQSEILDLADANAMHRLVSDTVTQSRVTLLALSPRAPATSILTRILRSTTTLACTFDANVRSVEITIVCNERNNFKKASQRGKARISPCNPSSATSREAQSCTKGRVAAIHSYQLLSRRRVHLQSASRRCGKVNVRVRSGERVAEGGWRDRDDSKFP